MTEPALERFDLMCVIKWLEAGCAPSEAAKELRGYIPKLAALLSRLDKAEAGEPDEAKIAAARERAEALGPGMPGIMRTAFADIAENAIRQYFRPLPPPPSES